MVLSEYLRNTYLKLESPNPLKRIDKCIIYNVNMNFMKLYNFQCKCCLNIQTSTLEEKKMYRVNCDVCKSTRMEEVASVQVQSAMRELTENEKAVIYDK